MSDDFDTDDLETLLSTLPGLNTSHNTESPQNPQAETPQPSTSKPDDNDDLGVFLETSGLHTEREVPIAWRPWMDFHTFVLVQSVEEVNRIVDEAIADGHCSLDLECEGLDNRIEWDSEGRPHTVHKIVGFCMAYGKAETAYYIPVRHRPTDQGTNKNVTPVEEVEAAISRLCHASQPVPEEGAKDPLSFTEIKEKPKVVLDFWHAKFDQEFLFPITGIDWWHPDSFEDGMLAAFVKFSGDKNLKLKEKGRQYLRDPKGVPYDTIELKELFPNGRKIDFPSLSPDEPGVTNYGCQDGVLTRLLCSIPDLVPLVRKQYALTYRLEKQVSQVMRVLERNRMRLSRSKIQALKDRHEKKFQENLSWIQALASSKGFPGLDPSSPKQLSEFLFSSQGLDINPKPPINESSRQYKTDADTLTQLAETLGEDAPEILKRIISYREEEKILGTYLNNMLSNLDQNDEMRFAFKQTGAPTGRFSAPAGKPDQGFSGIPVHGIPHGADMRQCFEARQGYILIKSDYSGQELRIVSNVSHEPVWVKEFLHGKGDLHSITARAFFNKQEISKEERGKGKTANFALIYGGGPQAIMRATGCGKEEGARRKQAFDKSVPTFAKWIKSQHAKVKKDLGIWTAFGRWCAIPDANHVEERIRAACERYATNYPIQGAGADVMKIALVLLHKEFHRLGWLRTGDDSVRMLLTVHDEIVFEIKYERVVDAIPVIVRLMEFPSKLPNPSWEVPLIVEPLIGPSWGTGYLCEKLHLPGEEDQRKGFLAKLKEKGSIVVGDYVYSTTREVDLGKDEPGLGEEEVSRTEKKMLIRMVDPLWLKDKASDPTTILRANPSVLPSSLPLSENTQPELSKAEPKRSNGQSRVVIIRLKELSHQTVQQLRGLLAQHYDETGDLLHLVDANGSTLIDPRRLPIRINAAEVLRRLQEIHLSVDDLAYEN